MTGHKDRIIIFTTIISSIIVWYPTRHLPFHWDSAAFAINAAKNLYETNFNPLIASGSEFAHPPLYPALIALSWKIFGDSRLVTHLTILPFFILLLTSAYFMGKKIHTPKTGIIAAVLVAVTPFVLAELGMPYLDLAAGALAAAGLTAWLFNRPKLAILFISLAVLTKFTVIILLIPIIYTSIKQKRSGIVYWLIPIGLMCLWLFYHHTVTGWWLTLPGRDTVLKLDPVSLFNSLKFVFYVFFIRQGRWLLTLILLIASKSLRQRSFLLIAIGCPLLAYAITGEFIPRYAIAVLPAFYVLSVTAIFKIIKQPYSQLVILAIIFLFISSLRPQIPDPNSFQFRINEDLSYQDHIQIGQEVGKFLETNYPEKTIIGSFPQLYQLTEPWQGYITHPLKYYDCNSSTLFTSGTLIVIHPYHYTQFACQELLAKYPHTLLIEFNHRQIWAQIYQFN
jgi:hypothetical protein